MKKRKLIDFLKWTWLIVVIGAATWYVIKNYPTIREYFNTIQPIRIAASLVLILIGKFATADLTFQSLKIVRHEISAKKSFSIATVTQLGKYLPGGVWHFAGKFGIYKTRGMRSKAAILPMIIENLWLFSSAFITGFLFLVLSKNRIFCELLPVFCHPVYSILISIIAVVLWFAALDLVPRFILKQPVRLSHQFRLIFQQIFLWIIFGLSLWLIFPIEFLPDHIFLSISAFSISWLAGYAAFFAPGGIGIREAVLTLILGSILSGEMITIFVSIHRLLWILIEILLGLGSAFFIGMPFSRETEQED